MNQLSITVSRLNAWVRLRAVGPNSHYGPKLTFAAILDHRPVARYRPDQLPAGRCLALRRMMGPATSLIRCRKGVVAFEFVVVAPVLLLILFAILYLAIALNNYLILTAAAQQGAQILSFGRGTATPYSKADAAVTSAAVSLTGTITKTVTIGGFDLQRQHRLRRSAHRRRHRLCSAHLSLRSDVHGLQLRWIAVHLVRAIRGCCSIRRGK